MASKNKAWENRINTSRRRVPNRDIKNTFLIYCEEVNTEPEYFKSFPVTTETEVIAIGLGRSHRALVEKSTKCLEVCCQITSITEGFVAKSTEPVYFGT
jgi:hypothetical protein